MKVVTRLERRRTVVGVRGVSTGLDGITTEQVKADAEEFLHALEAQLKDRSFRLVPVRLYRPLGFAAT